MHPCTTPALERRSPSTRFLNLRWVVSQVPLRAVATQVRRRRRPVVATGRPQAPLQVVASVLHQVALLRAVASVPRKVVLPQAAASARLLRVALLLPAVASARRLQAALLLPVAASVVLLSRVASVPRKVVLPQVAALARPLRAVALPVATVVLLSRAALAVLRSMAFRQQRRRLASGSPQGPLAASVHQVARRAASVRRRRVPAP